MKSNGSDDGALQSVKAFFFLDFVHRLYFNKITTFRKLDLLPSSGKKEGQKPSDLRLAQPARVSGPCFLPEDRRISSFRNVVILLKYRRWTKSQKTAFADCRFLACETCKQMET
jgi:hypothetical protein